MYGLFDELNIINYTEVIAVYDDIKAFIERELLQTTDKEAIEAYKKVLKHIKGIRKAADEEMY